MVRKKVLSGIIGLSFLLFCIHVLHATNLVPIYQLLLLGGNNWLAPANLTAVPLSGGAIRLTWQDKSDGETAFEIEEKHPGSGDFSLIMEVVGNKSMCTVSALTGYYLAPDMEHQFRIRAKSDSRYTEYSNIATATTFAEPTTPPAAPSNLHASAVSPYAIITSWIDNSDNEYSFYLEKSEGCTTYTWAANIAPDSSLYTVDGLKPNQRYCFRLRAENPVGESAWSNVAEATTPIDVNIPNAPSSLTASACQWYLGIQPYVTFSLSWQDNADNETNFVLYYLDTLDFGHGTWTLVSPVAPVQNAEHYSFFINDRPGSFILRLAAVNEYGQSPFVYAAVDYAGDCSPPVVSSPPAAPDPVVATARSENTIGLTWTDVNYESGYRIYRREGTTGLFNLLPDGARPANESSYEDSYNLSPSTTYYYKVEAWNGAGSSESSVVSAATEGVATTPVSPTNLLVSVVEGSSTSLSLSWTDNSDNETYFQIMRSQNPTTGWAEIATPPSSNGTTFLDEGAPNGLDPCTPYYYRVYAWNLQGSSTSPAEGSGTTLPPPPLNLVASQGTVNQAIYLDWDEESCADGYNLYEMKDQINGWQLLNDTAPLTTNYADIYDPTAGLAIPSGIAYFYRVRSVDSDGVEGPASDYVVGWAGSPVPQEVAASRGLYPDKISLEWKPIQVCPDGNLTTASYVREYDIAWSDSPGGPFVLFKTATLPGTPYTDGTVPSAPTKYSTDIKDPTPYFPGVSSGSEYYFVVTSVYKDDNDCNHIPDNDVEWLSDASVEAKGWAQPQAPTYLPAPTWVSASDGTSTTKIDVSWAPVTGAAKYKVYRSDSSFGPWTEIRTINAPTTGFANTTSDAFFNIIAGTGYFYYVIPVDGNNILGYPSNYDGGYAITNVPDRW